MDLALFLRILSVVSIGASIVPLVCLFWNKQSRRDFVYSCIGFPLTFITWVILSLIVIPIVDRERPDFNFLIWWRGLDRTDRLLMGLWPWTILPLITTALFVEDRRRSWFFDNLIHAGDIFFWPVMMFTWSRRLRRYPITEFSLGLSVNNGTSNINLSNASILVPHNNLNYSLGMSGNALMYTGERPIFNNDNGIIWHQPTLINFPYVDYQKQHIEDNYSESEGFKDFYKKS